MTVAYDFEALRRSYPLVNIAGRSVALKRSRDLKIGCCPFHPDRSPSFTIYPDDTYHCFGCGAHGDVIDYVRTEQGLNTAEAIAWLTGGDMPSLNDEDREQRRRDRERAERRRQAEAAAARIGAQRRWDAAVPVNGAGHPYLTRKNVAPYGARHEGDLLLLPIRDAAGAILSVQSIAADGAKMFHPGAPVAGGRLIIGEPTDRIIVVEGFATGATVHAATGLQVAIAFSKAGVKAVARALVKEGRTGVVIGADTNAADEMKALADELGVKVVLPDMAGAEGTDFNDQAAHYGPDDVAALFVQTPAALAETPLPLIWAKDVAPVLDGNWIVKRAIPADGFVSVIGEPGCGKSFFILDLACHIAAGLEWRGRKVRGGLVVYLAAEGQRGQMNRVEAWKRQHGITDMPLALIPVSINLRDSAADLPKLIATVEAAVALSGLPLVMLVVDTLNRAFGGGDENGEDMGQYVANADRLRKHFGCTTCHVHHIPKSGDLTERGHGSLRGAIDTSLGIRSDPETGLRTLLCLKQKDGEDGWSLTFRLNRVVLGSDEDGEDVTTCVAIPAEEEAPASSGRGPSLSAVQRQVYNELIASLEAVSVGIPRDIPDDIINRQRVGKVVQRKVWRDRWIAVAGADRSKEVADATFRRAATELQNKGLVGAWNDHAWATFQ